MTKTTAIIRREQPPMGIVPRSMGDLQDLAQACMASGFFSDVKEAGQALIKIQAGAELGLPPVQSMTGINVIKGRITLSAGLMAALLKRAGYKLRVVWGNDPRCCNIAVFEGGELIGDSSFSTDDAKQAQLQGQNWQKYTRNMLYARAISNAARWYAPEVLTGCYLPDELEDAPVDLRPAQPVVIPSHEGLDPMVEPDVADPDIHPGEGWQTGNRRLRAMMRDVGISNEEMKALIDHLFQTDSSRKLSARDLHDIADAIEKGPQESDLTYEAQALEMIRAAGGADAMGADDKAQLADLATHAWQMILLDRALTAKVPS